MQAGPEVCFEVSLYLLESIPGILAPIENSRVLRLAQVK